MQGISLLDEELLASEKTSTKWTYRVIYKCLIKKKLKIKGIDVEIM
jgi:hypothetical protein